MLNPGFQDMEVTSVILILNEASKPDVVTGRFHALITFGAVGGRNYLRARAGHAGENAQEIATIQAVVLYSSIQAFPEERKVTDI